MILLIDNYDSFTYNLKQYLEELNQKVEVVRNDALTLDSIEAMGPSHIIISPGPGRPEDAGVCVDAIRKFSGKIPILGVCLGHQAIGYAFGADIIPAATLMHGKTAHISHRGKGVFANLNNNFTATRYHSLVIDASTIPAEIEITAESEDGEIMGAAHRFHLTEGVQFHPESILTEEGKNLLKNFISYTYSKKPLENGAIIRKVVERLIAGEDMSNHEANTVMVEIMEGRCTDVQIASFLTALRIKGETAEEITAFANVMREKSVKINPAVGDVLDTCGTGGDGSGTFNISTASAFVAAAAGVKVAKHGNRSVSSKSGSADVLEALNVNIDLTPKQVEECIEKTGIGFLFAPKLHPAMKHAVTARREMGIRTVFNLLGPLTNPAGARYQVMGVYSSELVEKIGQVLKNIGIVKGYVVNSSDGLDEVSLSAPTRIAEITPGGVRLYDFKPEDVGMTQCSLKDVAGGNSADNAEIILSILSGATGPKRDIVCLNAGFAIAAYKGVSIEEGVQAASEAIDSGRAMQVLNSLKELSNSI